MKEWTFEEIYKPLSEEMLNKLSTRRLINYHKKWRNLILQHDNSRHYHCDDETPINTKIDEHRSMIKKILDLREHIERNK